MEPLVSIITPSYNSARFLNAYFDSILRQDYVNYEVIFINDGSTDETDKVVTSYKKIFEEKGKRFIYLKQENGGQAKAINTGLPYIQGKYFIWPDSDDELCVDNISAKVEFMESHPEVSLGISQAEYIREDGSYIETMMRKPMENDQLFIDLLTSKNVVFCPGVFILKTADFFECLPQKRINEARIGQNYQILLPVVYRKKWGYINKPLYRYILHPNSHSNAKGNLYDIQIKRFKLHEKTLYELIDEICEEDKKQYYVDIIFNHFHKFYLRLANKYSVKKDSKDYFNDLKSHNAIDFKDIIYHVCTQVGVKRR